MLKIVSGSNFLEITGLAMTPWLCDSVQVFVAVSKWDFLLKTSIDFKVYRFIFRSIELQ